MPRAKGTVLLSVYVPRWLYAEFRAAAGKESVSSWAKGILSARLRPKPVVTPGSIATQLAQNSPVLARKAERAEEERLRESSEPFVDAP